MTIENWELYTATHWDWACLDGCFSGRIRPSDVDGIVERNGHFLILETKSPDAQLHGAQRKMFERFPGTVMVIWGAPGAPTELLELRRGQCAYRGQITLEELRQHVRTWFAFADAAVSP